MSEEYGYQKLPNFLVVGAAKAGTTSLYRYLDDHPDFYMSPTKEPFFFSFMEEEVNFQGPRDSAINDSIINDWKEYKSLFEGAEGHLRRGECSNGYLYYAERTASRIEQYLNEPKILILLRDPTERAYSQYLQHRMLGHEELTFREALNEEESRSQNGWRWHYQYRDQGKYFEQVRVYLDIFDEDKVRMVLFDDLVRNTRKCLKKICRFLGTNAGFFDGYKFEVYNETGLPVSQSLHAFIRGNHWLKEITRPFTPIWLRRNVFKLFEAFTYSADKKPTISPDLEAHLRRYFTDDIQKLENLIGRDLSHWKEKSVTPS